MPIPSVVIEPASSNEGDDDRDADIISPTAISDNDVTVEKQTIKHMSPSGGVSGFPDDFLYKVKICLDSNRAKAVICILYMFILKWDSCFSNCRWRRCTTLRLQIQMS